MSIDFISRQPFLGIYWISFFFLSYSIFNYHPKVIPLIKKSVVLLFISCLISGVIFIFPNYTNSYMQQHFLNGAHNFKFGLYNFNDLHSGFYGPLTYWLFTWWKSNIIFSISFAKAFIFIFFAINSFLIIKLMPKASNYMKLSVIFLIIAQAYYFYLGVHQFIIFFTLLIYIFGFKKVRDGYYQRNLYNFNNIIIVSLSTICLFLLKPHLIIYGFLSIPLIIKYKENKNWFYFAKIKVFNFLTFIISSLIFLISSEKFFKFSISSYFDFLSIPSKHGIHYDYFFGLIIVNILLIYAYFIVRSKIDISFSKNIFYIFPISLISLVLIYASSKHGSDLSHILPLWTLIVVDTFNSFCLIKNKEKLTKKFNFIKSLLIIFPLFFLPLTVESYGSTYKWYLKIESDLITKEIQYIKNKYTCQSEKELKSNFKSCISFGMGKDKNSLQKIMYLSPLITSKSNYNLVDISMVRDKYDSGYFPYYKVILSGKEVGYFIIPKGDEPFSMGVDIFSGNQIEPMISNEGVDYFKSNYEIIESTILYDVYQSKYIN